jgi:beta-aspartyl-dipeptidase (metallo-type)
MTPEINISELIACGTTSVVGLLGTDGSSRSIKSLYAKTKALESEGLSAYMFTGYYGLDPVYITESVQDDMVFVQPVLGCKIAITDIRSSFPTELELLRLLRQIMVGGMLANKKGILHLHLGGLKTKMDILFKLVEEHEFPISHISPTHVGRTKDLFDQAIVFAKLGGMIDITTGASKYTDPYKSVLYALEQGVSMDKMTFSSDGNAGLDKLDEKGNLIGFRRAPIHQNYEQVKALIHSGNVGIEEAVKLITANPASNLGLKTKGNIYVGCDADFCCLDSDFNLTEVFAKGKLMMENSTVIAKGHFE